MFIVTEYAALRSPVLAFTDRLCDREMDMSIIKNRLHALMKHVFLISK